MLILSDWRLGSGDWEQVGQIPNRQSLVLVTLEHFARAAILGRADDALLLQQVDQLGRLAIADPQAALQQRGRGALVLLDQLDRLGQQLILLLHAQKFAWPFEAGGWGLGVGSWGAG